MIQLWFSRSIRTRLTVWYAVVLASILLAYAGGAYLFLRQNLYGELDRQLNEDIKAAGEDLEKQEGNAWIVRKDRRHPYQGEGDGPGERWLEVWSLDGKLLYREGKKVPTIPPAVNVSRDAEAAPVVTIDTGTGGAFRVRSAVLPINGVPVLIRVARSETRLHHELGEFLAGIGLGMPIAVFLACVGGYFLAGRALKPVRQMATRAKTITAEHLGERLPIENPEDELGQLGTVFNDTLARLERSFDSLRRFTADAAHELRTPLTAIRSVGEVGLSNAKDEAEYLEAISSMLEEADRLARLVDTLLTLSRADSGRFEVHPERLALREFALQMSEYLGVLAEEKRQTLIVEGDEKVYAWADPFVLRQAVINVLDNAIKYSPIGARIKVETARLTDYALIEIKDTGPGIAEEHQERIFDRFYRVDRARSRQTGGAGLGLSIARWAVEANGGRIEIESRTGEGSSFRILLPRATAD